MTLQNKAAAAVVSTMSPDVQESTNERVAPSHALVKRLLGSCVTELFGSYGVHAEIVDGAGRWQQTKMELGAIIGFRGNGVRGGLAFVAPTDLLTALIPVALSTDADAQLRDWTAEVSNQLLGRLKNKLSARSIDFDVGMPTCFSGKSIRFVFLPDADGLSVCIRARGAWVRVHLECSFADDLAAGDVTDVKIVAEGDMLLF